MKTSSINKAKKIVAGLVLTLAVSTSVMAQEAILSLRWNNFKAGLAEKLADTESVFITVSYTGNETHFEAWMTDLKSWAVTKLNAGSKDDEDTTVEEWMTEPFVVRSISCNAVEIIREEEQGIESWMTSPFSRIQEEVTEVEPWMTKSWELDGEEDIRTEAWMCDPSEWL